MRGQLDVRHVCVRKDADTIEGFESGNDRTEQRRVAETWPRRDGHRT